MGNTTSQHPHLPELDPEDIMSSEVIEPPLLTNENSIVRQIAMQVLYEVDSAKHPFGTVIEQQLRHNELSERGLRYLRQLVSGILENLAGLDKVISRFAPEWPVEQIAFVDRNVLRIAIYEIHLTEGNVPIKVAIDEAVELAKWFGAEGSSRFVNGVLGAVADNPGDVDSMLHPS